MKGNPSSSLSLSSSFFALFSASLLALSAMPIFLSRVLDLERRDVIILALVAFPSPREAEASSIISLGIPLRFAVDMA